MPRPTSQQIDDEILDVAATLFARHGIAETSLQRIADAVGYSKTGLLHRFASKDALQQAVLDRSVAELRTIGEAVGGMAPGPSRDRVAITELVDLTVRRPGTVALMLSIVSAIDVDHPDPAMEAVGDTVFAAFATDKDDLPRSIRVVGALGALAVASVACSSRSPAEVGPLLIAVAYDALGHPT